MKRILSLLVALAFVSLAHAQSVTPQIGGGIGFGFDGGISGKGVAVVAPTPWTPLQLNVTNPGTLLAWWDANSGTSFPGSGTCSWTDRVSGIVASSSGATCPTFSATARNGTPGVIGNGSQHLSFSPSSFPSGTAVSTIAIAGYANSSGSTAAMFTYGGSAGSALRAIYKNSSGTGVVTDNGGYNFNVATWSNNDLFTVWLNNGTAQTVNYNGNPPSSATVTAGSTVLSSGWMFAWIDGTTFPAAGVIQQVLVLSRALTLDELTKLAGWESRYDGKAGANLPKYSPYFFRTPLISDNSQAGPVRQSVSSTSFPNSLTPGAQAGSTQILNAAVNMYDVQITIPNVYSTPETAIGGTFTYTAALEYPAGNCQRITFSGLNTGTSTGTSITSDDVTLSTPVPLGASVTLHLWSSSSAGNFPIMAGWLGAGSSVSQIGTTVTDTTSCSGSLTQSPANTGWGAVVIASHHSQPSVVSMGDSIAFGQGNNGSFASAGTGIVTVGLNGYFGNASFGIPADTLGGFLGAGNSPLKISLGNSYFGTIVDQYGINDFGGGTTAATLQTESLTFEALFPGRTNIRTTITPHASSSDNFATTANQTPASYTAALATFNSWARARGTCKYFDLAAPLSFGVDTNIWNVGLTATNAPWSGIHPTNAGYGAEFASGAAVPTCVK